MNKNYIGVLDMGFEGLIVLDELSKRMKNENFIYVNDYKNSPYEGKSSDEIVDLITSNVIKLCKYDIKMIIVISDTIMEYASEYLSTLKIPVINIVDVLIDYVNTNYEQKNMILLAKKDILGANLYQKNFKYNHLYNIDANQLINIIEKDMIKTAESFETVSRTFRNIQRKETDVIINSSPYLVLLHTEVDEYIDANEFINVGVVIARVCADKLKEGMMYNIKGRGHKYILMDEHDKGYTKICDRYTSKYKVIYHK